MTHKQIPAYLISKQRANPLCFLVLLIDYEIYAKIKSRFAVICGTIWHHKIRERIRNKEDIFNRDYKYQKVNIDNTFPEYIVNNLSKFDECII